MYYLLYFSVSEVKVGIPTCHIGGSVFYIIVAERRGKERGMFLRLWYSKVS